MILLPLKLGAKLNKAHEMNVYTAATIGLVLLVLLYFAYQWNRIASSVRISTVLISKTASYMQHPHNAQMHILVAGDSTAVGVGAVTSEQSIAGRLGARYPSADIENVSQSGLTLQGLQEALSAHLSATSSYDFILLQIGANDVTALTSRSAVRSRLDAVLSLCASHTKYLFVMTSGNVGLSPVFGLPLRLLFTGRSLMVRNVFMAEAAKYTNVYYLDLYKSAQQDPFNKDIARCYARDLFHPSGVGYLLWYTQLQELIDAHTSYSLKIQN